MTKRAFISIILGVAGGLVFAIGMCMCLIPEWGSFTPGVVVTSVGAVILFGLLIYRIKTKDHEFRLPSKKTVGTVIPGVAGALVLGLGMCMTMVWENMMIPGMIVGVVGILLLVCLIPAIKGFKTEQ